MAATAPATKSAARPAAAAAGAKGASAKPKAAAAREGTGGGMIAAVLVRGRIGARHDVVRSLDGLRLRRKHVCSVVPDTAVYRGLLRKCKDFITYGPIDAATLAQLREKRKQLKDNDGNPIDVFRMNSPRGGYAGKGTKVSYQEGGALGLRRETMGDFLRKMM